MEPPLRRRSAAAVLEHALDLSVERVQPIERERLGRGKALPGGRIGPVVEDHAVLEREPALAVEDRRRVLGDHAQPELDVTQQLALAAALDLGAVGELAGLAEVVDDRGADQQVAIQARVQRAQLERHGGHGDGVLEQAAEVGVMARRGARARRDGRPTASGRAPSRARGGSRSRRCSSPSSVSSSAFSAGS